MIYNRWRRPTPSVQEGHEDYLANASITVKHELTMKM